MTTDLDAIRAKGKTDYFTNNGKYSNPYPLNSPEFNAYERGWMKSLKDDGARIVGIERGASAQPARPSFNMYAEKKGQAGPRKP